MRIFKVLTLIGLGVLASNCGNQVPDRDRQILVAEARQSSNLPAQRGTTPATNPNETITPVGTTPARTANPGTTPAAGGGAMLTCAQSFSQNLASDLASCAGCHASGSGGLTLVADADADNLETIQAEGFSLFIDKVGPTANPTHAAFAAFEEKFTTVGADCP